MPRIQNKTLICLNIAITMLNILLNYYLNQKCCQNFLYLVWNMIHSCVEMTFLH